MRPTIKLNMSISIKRTRSIRVKQGDQYLVFNGWGLKSSEHSIDVEMSYLFSDQKENAFIFIDKEEAEEWIKRFPNNNFEIEEETHEHRTTFDL